MATSGSYLFDPEIAEVCDEAFERCGVDPASLIFKHAVSARRSLSYVFTQWATEGVHNWAVQQETQVLTEAISSYTVPMGTIALLDVVLRDSSSLDTPLSPMSRKEYHELPNKATAGSPSHYYLDRALVKALYVYPVQSVAGYSLVYNYMRQIQSPGAASNTLGIPSIWQEALVSALAAKLAEKYSPEREMALLAKASKSFATAKRSDNENVDTEFEITRYRRR